MQQTLAQWGGQEMRLDTSKRQHQLLVLGCLTLAAAVSCLQQSNLSMA
jgi:hypothetical protein